MYGYLVGSVSKTETAHQTLFSSWRGSDAALFSSPLETPGSKKGGGGLQEVIIISSVLLDCPNDAFREGEEGLQDAERTFKTHMKYHIICKDMI